MSTQLHSILAVEKDKVLVSNKILNEAVTTFSKRDQHFEGFSKQFEAFDDEDAKLNNIEGTPIVTTVADKLKYIADPVAAAIDVVLMKEETNSNGSAKAELKVGDTSFGELSATSLLSLEKTLTSIRQVYSTIPTLDPIKKWERDEMREGLAYVSAPTTSFRTSKKEDFVITVQPTEFHPAQTEKVVKDVTIGKYTTTYTSGKLMPLTKSKILGRIDALLLAVKAARSKANQAKVVDVKLGSSIMAYINGDLN